MKRPVVMILLAGALTLSMAAPSILPAAADNINIVQAAEDSGDKSSVSSDENVAADEQKDKTETV